MTSLPPGLETFDHLIVLMLENRSFDNMLGYLYEDDRPSVFVGRGEAQFHGVAGRGDLWNPDGNQPPGKVYVGKAPHETPVDMCHPCPDPGEYYQPHVNRQLYGQDVLPGTAAELPDPAPMNGFVQDYIRAIKQQQFWDGVEPTLEHYRVIMNCFPPEAVPVLAGLARQFAVSDEWFASVPSQTWCNRSFLHSGQSHGFVTNADGIKWLDNRAPTIFERLEDSLGPEHGWRVYWDHQDIAPLTRFLHHGLHDARYDARFREFDRFAADCAAGDLPAYTFIQPRVIINHNDMHPPVIPNQEVHSSVLAGELLVNDIYDAVRSGKHWMRSVLVIVFDEHGGCYDHVPPPRAVPPVTPPPYPLQDGFAFDRFGVRVPAIFISPFVAPGTVLRAPGATPFDHTSLIRTLTLRWGLESLTDRDRAAPDFGAVCTLSEMDARRETPTLTPRTYTPISAAAAHNSLLSGFQKDLGRLLGHVLGRTVSTGITRVGDLLNALRGG
jgi:phospholipase C